VSVAAAVWIGGSCLQQAIDQWHFAKINVCNNTLLPCHEKNFLHNDVIMAISMLRLLTFLNIARYYILFSLSSSGMIPMPISSCGSKVYHPCYKYNNDEWTIGSNFGRQLLAATFTQQMANVMLPAIIIHYFPFFCRIHIHKKITSYL